MTSLESSLRCPDAERLTAYARQQLAAEESSAVTRHLSECDTCTRTLAELADSLTLAGPAVSPATAQPNDPTVRSPVPAEGAAGPSSLWSDGSSKPGGSLAGNEASPSSSAPVTPAARAVSPTSGPAGAVAGPAGSRMFGDYEILGKLGAGGMGEVYKAKHRRMDRIVAMKILPSEALNSAVAIERFHREVQASAKLIHPNIVAAYDAGEEQGVHYLAMEYVEGRDLAHVVESQKRIPAAQAVDYVQQAARGLAHAHKKGVVHRDVKPSNLILDVEGVIKVLDMGLAIFPGGNTAVDGPHRPTRSGIIMGTPAYMAPEQAADIKRTDGRADIYSLGCVLFFLLTGHDPFVEESFIATLIAHREAPVPSLCAELPGLSPILDRIFQRMMAKRPEDRFQSMAELIDALEKAKSAGLTGAGVGAGAASASLYGAPASVTGWGASVAGSAAGGAYATSTPNSPTIPAAAQYAASPVPPYGDPGGISGIGKAKTGSPVEQALLEALIAAGIVNEDEMADVLRVFPERLPTREALLAEIVRREWMSDYQATMIAKRGVAEIQMGQYLLWEKVIQGEHTALFTALHSVTRSLAAIKVFDAGWGPMDDLKLAAQLKHPNILPILDVGAAGARSYVASQYCHEADLATLSKKGRLETAETLKIILDVARGLGCAAQQSVFHGNVGPWNIFKTESGETCIGDFGWASRRTIATHPPDELRGSSSQKVSPADLAAPERLAGQPPDVQSDMHSLGSLMFHLLSMLPPRWNKDPRDGKTAVPKLSEYVDERLPAGIQRIFERLVAKNRQDRFATWDEAIRALENPPAFEESQRPKPIPVIKPPEKAPPHKQKGLGGLIAGATSLAAIVVGMLVASLVWPGSVGAASWGKALAVSTLVGLLWEFKGLLAEVAHQWPLAVGAAAGALWATFYYLLGLPMSDVMGELLYLAFGMATGFEIHRGLAFLASGLALGTAAGALGPKGALAAATGAWFPALALAALLSGYQIPEKEVAQDVREKDAGTRLIDQGDYAKAIAYYDEQIQSHPKRASLRFHRGRAHEGVRELEKALDDFAAAIKLAPDSADAYARRGDLYLREKDYERALADYTAALRINPRHPGTKTRRGEAYNHLGDHREAIADLEDALLSNTKDASAYLQRAKAYEALGMSERAEADRERAKALEQSSEGK